MCEIVYKASFQRADLYKDLVWLSNERWEEHYCSENRGDGVYARKIVFPRLARLAINDKGPILSWSSCSLSLIEGDQYIAVYKVTAQLWVHSEGM